MKAFTRKHTHAWRSIHPVAIVLISILVLPPQKFIHWFYSCSQRQKFIKALGLSKRFTVHQLRLAAVRYTVLARCMLAEIIVRVVVGDLRRFPFYLLNLYTQLVHSNLVPSTGVCMRKNFFSSFLLEGCYVTSLLTAFEFRWLFNDSQLEVLTRSPQWSRSIAMNFAVDGAPWYPGLRFTTMVEIIYELHVYTVPSLINEFLTG